MNAVHTRNRFEDCIDGPTALNAEIERLNNLLITQAKERVAASGLLNEVLGLLGKSPASDPALAEKIERFRRRANAFLECPSGRSNSVPLPVLQEVYSRVR